MGFVLLGDAFLRSERVICAFERGRKNGSHVWELLPIGRPALSEKALKGQRKNLSESRAAYLVRALVTVTYAMNYLPHMRQCVPLDGLAAYW